MSRLGKTPIALPKGIEVKGSKGEIEVKGPKGVRKRVLPEGISIKVEEELLFVQLEENADLPKPFHGLQRALLMNDVIGVSTGFSKDLSLIGVGYRATVKGDVLDLQLGFSHPSQINIPPELQVTVEEKNTLVKISGVDKQLVGQFAANVRSLRPPEPYKGKGIRYVDEYVRKKAGKAAKGK